MRLNRYLARAGLGARRTVEEGVREGLVTVNGLLVTNPATPVQPGDLVRWDGRRVVIPEPFTAVMNKPVGYETTLGNLHTARSVLELSHGMPPGTSPVGRLDVRTGGLLLWSNDGDLAYRLAHPRWAVEREYLLLLHAPVSSLGLQRLQKGAFIEPGQFSKPASVLRTADPGKLRVVLTTGRNREVRRLCSRCGLNLSGLERIRYGPIRLNGLPRGRWRSLGQEETRLLYGTVGLKP